MQHGTESSQPHRKTFYIKKIKLPPFPLLWQVFLSSLRKKPQSEEANLLSALFSQAIKFYLVLFLVT